MYSSLHILNANDFSCLASSNYAEDERPVTDASVVVELKLKSGIGSKSAQKMTAPYAHIWAVLTIPEQFAPVLPSATDHLTTNDTGTTLLFNSTRKRARQPAHPWRSPRPRTGMRATAQNHGTSRQTTPVPRHPARNAAGSGGRFCIVRSFHPPNRPGLPIRGNRSWAS